MKLTMYKKILLIDDDDDEQFIFLEALKELNISVSFFFANSAQEGFRLVEHVSPDIVFIDYNMPSINGLECLDMISGNNFSNHSNVVLYSTGMDNSLYRKAVEKGAFACIKKQGSVHDLANIIKNLL